MEESNKPALFQDNSMAIMASNDAAAVARATQEIQAALTIAQRFPRNEFVAKSKIAEACKRLELAEMAEYEYNRGGTRITGPTIDLLRAIANRWGNIRFGWSEVERREGFSQVRCFAWDLASNAQAERTFSVKHWRDTSGGGYALKDERDIYELMANQAARRVRACLEEVIDSDVVAMAVDQCRKTLSEGGKEQPIADRALKMLQAFQADHGVTQKQIETRLGNKLDAISENQLASLRRVYKSLRDGVGTREDYFKPETAEPNFAGAPAASGQPATAKSDSVPEVKTQPVTQQVAPVVKDPSPFNNPLQAVRGLCAGGKVTEGDLLGYLSVKGTTDGSQSGLDEVPVNVLKLVNDQWAAITGEIMSAKKGGAK